MKVSHRTMVLISGMIWLAAGVMLTQLGINLLTEILNPNSTTKVYFIQNLARAVGGMDKAIFALVIIALAVGFFKGKFVLEKSAAGGIARIQSMPNPSPITQIYNAKYYILLAAMMGLGMGIKFLGLPNDIRGPIDLAIGFALLNGSKVYFRQALFGPRESHL